MFGLDQVIAGLSHGSGAVVVLSVAVLLGLRHASDPDHLVAVSTLVASERERPSRLATRLGLCWGLGHASTLIALGVPIVLFDGYLPGGLQRAAEALVGVVIAALAVRLLRRWRQGAFHTHAHAHDGAVHRHLHPHGATPAHEHEHEHEHALVRSPLQAYGIGLLHGIGGSAAVGLLLLASIPDRSEALAALVLFAAATAASMAALSSCLGYLLARGRVRRRLLQLIPALGGASLLFGAWYSVGALAPLL